MTLHPSPVAVFAKRHGVSKRLVYRIGLDRLQAMSPDALAVTLNAAAAHGTGDQKVSRGGLRARGFKVKGYRG